MVYCLISIVARTCCLFHYLEVMEEGPGFAVSCHHCCEVWSYVYFHFKPVLLIWKELLCYNCLGTFIPLFLPLCLFPLLFQLSVSLWGSCFMRSKYPHFVLLLLLVDWLVHFHMFLHGP